MAVQYETYDTYDTMDTYETDEVSNTKKLLNGSLQKPPAILANPWWSNLINFLYPASETCPSQGDGVCWSSKAEIGISICNNCSFYKKILTELRNYVDV